LLPADFVVDFVKGSAAKYALTAPNVPFLRGGFPQGMKLRFTRHARNRMRLYGITTKDVEDVFKEPSFGPAIEGTRMVLLGRPAAKFAQKPRKVVSIEEKGGYVVLSAYPLKRSYRRRTR
jgi:hypothetical protein